MLIPCLKVRHCSNLSAGIYKINSDTFLTIKRKFIMLLLTFIGDFLLSEWLWGITFGWSYLLISVLVIYFFLRRFFSLSRFRCLFLSLSANGFSFLLYYVIVVGLFIHLLQWWYVPGQCEVLTGPFFATFWLGLIYTMLQISFFVLISKVFRINLKRLLTVAVLGNGVTIVLAYAYILIFVQLG